MFKVRFSRVIRCSYEDVVFTCKCYKEIEMPIAPFVGMRIFIEWEEPYVIQGVCYDSDHDILWASVGVNDYDHDLCRFEDLEDCKRFFERTIAGIIEDGSPWTKETKDDMVWWLDENYGNSEIGFEE